MTPLAPHLTAFLRDHLPRERGASPHTIASYADTFALLLRYAAGTFERQRTKSEGDPALRLQFLCQSLGEALKRRRTVERIEPHVEQTKTVGMQSRSVQRMIELFFGFDGKPPACPNHLGDAAVIPGEQIIVRAVLDVAFRAVSRIIQNDHDRIQLIANGCGEFHAGHLKRSVADQYQWAQLWFRQLHSNTRRHSESHRSVVRRSEKFRSAIDKQIGGAE